MLSGEPLMEDASIRDFNGGIGCHVVSALEQTLLLTKDMVKLLGFRRSEVFLHTKIFLGMVCTNSPLPFFFFFFFTHNYLAYASILLIWYDANSLFFVSRLSKIRSGLRR